MKVQAVYPNAQIEEVKGKNGMPKGLLLKHSKPPVSKLMVTVAKGVDKPVEE